MTSIKKILAAAATIIMTMSCNQNNGPKVLVLYYSQTDNTKTVAEEIASRLGADIEAVVPVNPYSGSYQETIDRCLKEIEADSLPEVKPLSSNLKKYDIVFLGYPIWFGTCAFPIASVLSKVDFSGKKIIPFCTFGSGGLESSTKDIIKDEPGAEVLPGYGVRASRIKAVPDEIDRFLKESGFLEGAYDKYDDFSDSHPVTDEESAIFDTAVSGYRMINAKAKTVSSRAVRNGTEYLFVAEDIPGNPAFAAGATHEIKVYVLSLKDKAPEFTRVVR